MSCLTIAFHATKRSMSKSEGLRSFGAVFFLIRVLLRESADAAFTEVLREIEVARDMVVCVSSP